MLKKKSNLFNIFPINKQNIVANKSKHKILTHSLELFHINPFSHHSHDSQSL